MNYKKEFFLITYPTLILQINLMWYEHEITIKNTLKLLQYISLCKSTVYLPSHKISSLNLSFISTQNGFKYLGEKMVPPPTQPHKKATIRENTANFSLEIYFVNLITDVYYHD